MPQQNLTFNVEKYKRSSPEPLNKTKHPDKHTYLKVRIFTLRHVVFSCIYNGLVTHFSSKDPSGRKKPYQLPLANRHKTWLFYSQQALERHTSVLLVEGENDTLSVLDSGLTHVVGLIGQISKEQISVDALTLLISVKNETPGR